MAEPVGTTTASERGPVDEMPMMRVSCPDARPMIAGESPMNPMSCSPAAKDSFMGGPAWKEVHCTETPFFLSSSSSQPFCFITKAAPKSASAMAMNLFMTAPFRRARSGPYPVEVEELWVRRLFLRLPHREGLLDGLLWLDHPDRREIHVTQLLANANVLALELRPGHVRADRAPLDVPALVAAPDEHRHAPSRPEAAQEVLVRPGRLEELEVHEPTFCVQRERLLHNGVRRPVRVDGREHLDARLVAEQRDQRLVELDSHGVLSSIAHSSRDRSVSGWFPQRR